MQTQISSGKDRPPMLAPEGSSKTTTEWYIENYKNVLEDIRNLLNAEAEAVHIILTGIDNDIYSTVDACLNAMEMWKAIKRLKQGESINVQDLKTNLYWEFGKFTSQDGESLESYYSRSQQPATRNKGKAYVNSHPPTYDQEPDMVTKNDALSKEKEIDKLMDLISLSFKKSTNLPATTSELYQTRVEQIRIILQELIQELARECHKPKRAKDSAYHKLKMLLYKQEEARFQLNAEQADLKDDTHDEPEDRELEAHYLYMAQIQEVIPYAADNSGPIFDNKPLQKVQPDNDEYNVFTNERQHPEQPKFNNDTYLNEQGDTNVTSDSMDVSTNGEEADQDDGDYARECDLHASLIDKLKCEIHDNKNRNNLQNMFKYLVRRLGMRCLTPAELEALANEGFGK
ncbi:hypothetical protein Tco_0902507 [Tanacetum coccineum]